jgi:tRNA(fMet)-specific endonuclease VapC
MLQLIDTTVVSDIMRRDPACLERLRSLEPRQVVLSAPVAAEIHFGLQRLDPDSRRRNLLEQEYHRLRACVSWADWTEHAAEVFGRLKATVQSAGTPVDDMDLIISSVASSLDAAVATSNVRHFGLIPDLEIVDWSKTA